jgi:hypothetical protein
MINQNELACNLTAAQAPDARNSHQSCRIDRIIAAVESDTSIEQLYSRLSAAEERSGQLDALNTELQRLASDLQAQAEKLTAENSHLKQQITELKAVAANSSLGPAAPAGQAAASGGSAPIRKTLSPAMSALLTKTGLASLDPDRIDAAALDRTLGSLTLEQRIAVKAEMARAGIID